MWTKLLSRLLISICSTSISQLAFSAPPAPSATFKNMVANHQYGAALAHTCKRFKMACSGINITSDSSKGLAYVDALRNRVYVSHAAFFAPYSRASSTNDLALRHLEADDRALYFKLVHEAFHLNSQSQRDRFIAANLYNVFVLSAGTLGNAYNQHVLELEAWNDTYDTARSLGFTQTKELTFSDRKILYDIEGMIEEYTILLQGGKI